jgi:RNA polymerase sigma-70 factor (ECF subfamily)
MDKRHMNVTEFLVKEYGNLLNYIRRRLNEASWIDAEDVIQDVAVNLFSYADISRPIENLSAYVYTALKNRIVDIHRKRLRYANESLEMTMKGTINGCGRISDDHPTAEIARSETLSRLKKAMDHLAIEEKAIIVATEFENKTFSELSVYWGIPIGTLLARKSRGLKKLRAIMSKKIDLGKENKNE